MTRLRIKVKMRKVYILNRPPLQDAYAVAVGNPREFVQTEKEDQEIAETCNRLIKNCIICWNYLYLTYKLRQINDNIKQEQLRSIISSHSIMTWSHINMLGEYDFSEEKRKDSVGILPLKMAI
ncbi:transposase [Rickettsiaceae bacterium]|nr:transposase [Rickettsiaceae bacterium]